MLIFKNVNFALISSLTPYIGNIGDLPETKKGRGEGSSDPLFLRPCENMIS